MGECDMKKVKIIKGEGWYEDEVGSVFPVEDQITYFRKSDGGMRVKHYIVAEEPGFSKEPWSRLIQCTHAKVFKDPK
jgi:hypothetical protein